MLADAHCHLALFAEPEQAIESARTKGIGLIITASDSVEESVTSIKLANGKDVFATIGISPEFAKQEEGRIEEIEELANSNRGKVVGIGEIGLDAKADATLEVQEKVFEAQLEIAKRLEMPVVIHSRGMLDRVIELIERAKPKAAMFHFFEGDELKATELARQGYYISIPPALTSKRKRIISALDLRNIVAETDSPVVGKAPEEVRKVIEQIASIKSLSFEYVAQQIAQNIRNMFSI